MRHLRVVMIVGALVGLGAGAAAAADEMGAACPFSGKPYAPATCLMAAAERVTEVLNLPLNTQEDYRAAAVQFAVLETQFDMVRNTRSSGKFSVQDFADGEIYENLWATLNMLMKAKLDKAEVDLDLPQP